MMTETFSTYIHLFSSSTLYLYYYVILRTYLVDPALLALVQSKHIIPLNLIES